MFSIGRLFVYAGFLAGALFFVERAKGGAGLYGAFLEGCGAAAALMVLFGLAARLHAGDRLASAQLPGGVGAEFESTDAVESVRAVVKDMTSSLVAQAESMSRAQADLATRLTRLEGILLPPDRPRD